MLHSALMFHHFYSDSHPKGQGAISADQFEKIIDKYEGKLLNANVSPGQSKFGRVRLKKQPISDKSIKGPARVLPGRLA